MSDTNHNQLFFWPLTNLSIDHVIEQAKHQLEGNWTAWFFCDGAEGIQLPENWQHESFSNHKYRLHDRYFDDLCNLPDVILPHVIHKKNWEASLLASKHELQIPYAKLILQNLLINEICKLPGRHLIISDDILFLDDVQKILTLQDIVSWGAGGKGRFSFAQKTFLLKSKIKNFFSGISKRYRKIQFYSSLMKRTKESANQKASFDHCDIVLMTWMNETDFQNEQLAYFGSMALDFKEKGYKVGFLGTYSGGLSKAEKALKTWEQSSEEICFLSSFWSVKLLVSVFISSFLPFLKIQKSIKLGDVNIYPALSRLKQYCWNSGEMIYPLLVRDTFSKADHLFPNNQNFVYLYEHQPWEMSLLAGLRETAFSGKAIAFQHGMLAPNYVGFSPSKYEVLDNALLADFYIVMGPFYRQLLEKMHIPRERILGSGAYRYGYLFDIKEQTICDDTKGVLAIATSINFDETSAIIKMCLEASKHNSGVRFLWNFHPMLGNSSRQKIIDMIEEYTGDSPKKFEYCDQKIFELLERADGCIFSGSGSAFDAWALGKKLIYIANPVRFSYCKVPDHVLFGSITNVAELSECLNHVAVYTETRISKGNSLEKYLTYPNIDKVDQIINNRV